MKKQLSIRWDKLLKLILRTKYMIGHIKCIIIQASRNNNSLTLSPSTIRRDKKYNFLFHTTSYIKDSSHLNDSNFINWHTIIAKIKVIIIVNKYKFILSIEGKIFNKITTTSI